LRTANTGAVLLKSAFSGARNAVRGSFLIKLALILLFIFCAFAISVYYIERNAGGSISSLGEAFWWLLVTVSTVGYGDYTTVTAAGRAMAAVLIVIGVGLVPFIAARFAAYMVTRRLREERGLEKIKAKNHTVICGWNEHLDTVLEGVISRHADGETVLVNSIGMEKMNEMLLKYKDSKMRYVHGDYTSEAILNLANVRQAGSVIVLADTAQGDTSNADEKVVLATLAVKTMNPRAWVCVEVMEQKTALHARRAGASEVITHGEHDPFLIASAATAEGVVLTTRELLSHREGNTLQQKAIPLEFVGKSFSDLAAYFKEKQNAILIGLYNSGKSLKAEDVLSGDYSMIDDFIERKFKEAGKEYLSTKLEIPQVNLNPGDDYIVGQNEAAIVIAC
jgi:voltage-gated potassium channel